MADGFRAAIFDVDGVLVDSPHERAWGDALQELMETRWADIRTRTTYAPERYTPRVYQSVISGKPRMSGARAALDYFEVPDAADRVEAYAERKQEMVVELIEAGEFTAFPDALRFVLSVRELGLRTAAASSSKNAGMMLGRIRLDTFADEQGLAYGFLRPGMRLLDVFDVDISGRDFARGKPDPEIFVTAGAELALPRHECFVVEDAVAGVEAARAGGMAALGVARADDVELLRAAQADLVVTSLDDVDLGQLAEGRLAARVR
jgi:beta-phosphoglucomutase